MKLSRRTLTSLSLLGGLHALELTIEALQTREFAKNIRIGGGINTSDLSIVRTSDQTENRGTKSIENLIIILLRGSADLLGVEITNVICWGLGKHEAEDKSCLPSFSSPKVDLVAKELRARRFLAVKCQRCE